MLSALAFACALFQQPFDKPSKPVVLSGPIKAGRCRIPLSVGGQTYLFLIDTGIEKSYIRGDAKAAILKRDEKALLSLAGSSVAVSDLPNQKSSVYLEIPQIAGVVGMDILSKIALSINYDKQQLTLWPENSAESDIEKAVFPKDQKLANISLIPEPGYLSLFMQTSLGECELDTGASLSLLARSATKSPEVFSTSINKPLELFEGGLGHASQVVVRDFQLGDDDMYCQPFLLSDSADVGVIAASQLSKTIYFDLPGKRVLFAVPTETEQACSAIGALLHGTVMDKNDELYLKAQLARNLGSTQSPWVRIVSIDGKKGSDWLSMYVHRDPSTADGLRKAYDSLSRDGKVIVERNGKQEQLLIAPYIQ